MASVIPCPTGSSGRPPMEDTTSIAALIIKSKVFTQEKGTQLVKYGNHRKLRTPFRVANGA